MQDSNYRVHRDPLARVGTGGEISDVNAFLPGKHRYYVLRAKMYSS